MRPSSIAGRHMYSTQHATGMTDSPPLGTAPPIPPISSFAVPSRAASYSRLWPEGRSCTHHSNSMLTCNPTSVVRENARPSSMSKTQQDSMHMRHPHIAMHSTKQHGMPNMQFALRAARLAHVNCSRCPGWCSVENIRTTVRGEMLLRRRMHLQAQLIYALDKVW
jgi:hypothetical protein